MTTLDTSVYADPVTEYDPRRHRSLSQLNSWARCGMAYYLERVAKVPSPPASWTIKGQVVHDTLEAWEKSERRLDVADHYFTTWAVKLDKWEKLYPDVESWPKGRAKTVAKDLELRRQDGWIEVQQYTERAVAQSFQWMPLRLPDGRLAVELPFKIDFGAEVPFFLMGYIDALLLWADGTITVCDYKTGGDKSENYRQLGLYAYAATTQYGVDVTWGEYWYTKLGRSSGWKDTSRYTRDYLYQQYSQLDKAIEEGIFIADPSKEKCFPCSVKQSCPEMKDR